MDEVGDASDDVEADPLVWVSQDMAFERDGRRALLPPGDWIVVW